MTSRKELTGKRFGRLMVLGLNGRTKAGQTRWLCQCDCGNQKTVSVSNLGSNTNSCGCLRNTLDGLSLTHPLYKRFTQMHNRCFRPSSKDYRNYGARGIKVCKRWHNFLMFLEDMEASFKPGLTLERKNNDGPYSPKNCRWASVKEQSRNKRINKRIRTPFGVTCVSEAAELAGVDAQVFHARVRRGWTQEELFNPANRRSLTKWDRRNALT